MVTHSKYDYWVTRMIQRKKLTFIQPYTSSVYSEYM